MKPGDRIGRYRIEKRLGEGGVGEVFRAIDEPLDRTVAVKRLRPELAERAQLVQRFRAEAQTLARLNHPNIATLYSLEGDGRTMWMVMEYVDGETVASLLRSRGPLALGPALQLFFQALDGIGYAHDHGVIHRDIKGSNLMVSSDGVLKIMDFGIARVLGERRVTRSGQLIGTPEFMSPEQIRGADADERSDLYALTIVLFAILSGRPPFSAPSEYDLMRAQVEAAPPSLVELCPDLPAALDAVVQRALSKAADDRYPSAAELRAALAPFASEPFADRLVWPARAPRFAGSAAEDSACCSLIGDSAVDIDAPTRVGRAVASRRGLPLIDAELIEERSDAPLEAPTRRLRGAPLVPTEGPERAGRGPLLRASWPPRLLLAGCALALIAGLDLVARAPALRGGEPAVASSPRSPEAATSPAPTPEILATSIQPARAAADEEEAGADEAHAPGEPDKRVAPAAPRRTTSPRAERPVRSPGPAHERASTTQGEEQRWVIRR